MPQHREAPKRGRLRTWWVAVIGPAAVAAVWVTPAVAAPTATPPPPCTPSADACVSLSADAAWLMSDGVVTRGPVPITHGAPGDETPVGTFAVQWKDADHVSGEVPGAQMPYSVFFDLEGRAFHGGSLETDSVGCVHLGPGDDIAFFDALEPGDEVQIHA